MSRFIVFFIAVIYLVTQVFISHGICASNKLISSAGKDSVMVAVFAKQGAEDYKEYAEGALKERLRSIDFKIINAEMSEKIKKDRLLLEAIRNSNATVIAKISSDYGAGIIIRATLQSVVSNEKLSDSCKGLASISLVAIDTRTGEEIESVNSEPMGVSDNPSPIEDSSQAAKQMAILKAIDNILFKMGAASEVLSQAASISPKFYAAFKEGEATAVTFSPDSTLLAAAINSAVKIFSVDNKNLLKTLKIQNGNVTSFAFSSEGNRLVALSTIGDATIFKMPQGEILRVIETDTRGRGVLAISPDGNQLASGGGDGYIRVWDVSSGCCLLEIKAHREKIHSLAFANFGKTVISASNDLCIKFWDLATRREIKAFQEPMDQLSTATVSNDCSLIAYSSKTVDIDLLRRRRIDKRYIRLRDTLTGKDISTFEGHAKDINTLAFMPGKRFIVSGADDKLVKIWDMEKRGEISNLEQNDKVSSVAVSRDGKWLCAASNEIVMWRLK